jgi:cardiolipin synthase
MPEEPAPETTPVNVSVAGHELTLFVETLPLVASMLLDIRAAQKRVWLETYIFANDTVGRAVAEALEERARAGLDVRVLYDAIGCQATSSTLFAGMQHAGIQVHAFHSVWEALWRFSFLRVLNRRNHRKLLVVDDQAAYFGGMNLVAATTTIPPMGKGGGPVSAGWRDLHVRLAGPQQWQLAESFDRSWRAAHGERLTRRPRAYRQAQLASGEESIQFFDSGPGLKHTRAARLFVRLLRAARKQITLSMAYFLPVGVVLRTLLRARRRGVFIRVVVPGNSDVPLVQHAMHHLYSVLLRRRFRIYERQLHMLHSKMMIVDDQWSVVGSCNFDARSLWINLEFLAVIRSRRFAQIVNEIVAHEVALSRRITLKGYLERSWWRRLINRLAWLLRWWL